MILLDELEEVRFLGDLSAESVRRIAQLAQLREFCAGSVIFAEGQNTPFVYLILEGEVAIEIHVPGRGNASVQTLQPGELLGWSPLLRSGPMTATARALTRCRLAALDTEQIRALGEHEPHFVMELLRCTAMTLARRLSATRLKLLGG